MRCVGFTGTQKGMTNSQIWHLFTVLEILRIMHTHFTHGVCIGSDEQAHEIARDLGYGLRLRPGNGTAKRANCRIGPDDVIFPPKPPLIRNDDIVTDACVLVATPRGFKEELRSGTWATIRRARKAHRPVIIIPPMGSIVIEQNSKPAS